MGRFTTTPGFTTLGVGTPFDSLETERPNHHQTGYQSRIWHQNWRAARLRSRSQPQTVFMCIGTGIEEMVRTIARWWFGLRRRRYPIVGLTICWWHFGVCDIFRWSSPDGGCIGDLFEGGRFGIKCFQNPDSNNASAARQNSDNSKRSGNGNFGCD